MKKLLSLLLVVVLVASFATITASAAPDSSTATLNLEGGDLEIIDPPGPGPHPELPGIEVGGKDMNFGTRTVSTSNATYNAIKAGTTGADQDLPANYKPVGLVVADARGESVAKWDVKVKVSDFKNAASAVTLTGFELTLTKTGAIVGAGANTPVGSDVTIKGDGVEKVIFNSKPVDGSPGLWGGNWQPSLLVKAGTGTVANHSATVTWTVAVTP